MHVPIHHNLKLQNHALAIRQELGFPLTPMANESVKFTAGGEIDIMRRIELARLAEEMSRDFIYCAWTSVTAEAPASVAVVFREEHLVDVIGDCVLWASDNDAPLVLLNERGGEHFVRGARNVLERRAGLPGKNLSKGKRLALRRVRNAAAARGDNLLPGNAFVPNGERWADHRPQMQNETIVRLV
jgi:hypothetical protein